MDREVNLELTPVTIGLLEAPGKTAPAGAAAFRLAPVGRPVLSLAPATALSDKPASTCRKASTACSPTTKALS